MAERKTIENATKQLLTFVKEKREDKERQGKTALFGEHGESVFVQFAFKKALQRSKIRPIMIPISHSIYEDDIRIALFVKDPQRTVKDDIEELGEKRITKVIGVSKIKKYSSYEDIRSLLGNYQLLLSDIRVAPLVADKLGSVVYRRKRTPLPIRVTSNKLSDDVTKCLASTHLFLLGGASATAKVGNTEMDSSSLIENVIDTISHAFQALPGGMSYVQAVYIKSSSSPALPVYASLPDRPVKLKDETKVKVSREPALMKNEEDFELDLSDLSESEGDDGEKSDDDDSSSDSSDLEEPSRLGVKPIVRKGNNNRKISAPSKRKAGLESSKKQTKETKETKETKKKSVVEASKSSTISEDKHSNKKRSSSVREPKRSPRKSVKHK